MCTLLLESPEQQRRKLNRHIFRASADLALARCFICKKINYGLGLECYFKYLLMSFQKVEFLNDPPAGGEILEIHLCGISVLVEEIPAFARMTTRLIMQRKIFIGIELSPAVKKRLMQKVEKWKDLPIRWSREENLHLNLINLGHVEDEIVYEICTKVRKVSQEMDLFDIDMDKIELTPSSDKNAKSINFTGGESDKLKFLCEEIEKALGIFSQPKKIFRPSITLGRIQQYGWQKLEPIPEVGEDFTVLLPIESVEIFESTLIDGKRKFASVESCPLKC